MQAEVRELEPVDQVLSAPSSSSRHEPEQQSAPAQHATTTAGKPASHGPTHTSSAPRRPPEPPLPRGPVEAGSRPFSGYVSPRPDGTATFAGSSHLRGTIKGCGRGTFVDEDVDGTGEMDGGGSADGGEHRCR